MAKGITQEQVANAADALFAAGERPTVERIRAFLGTGSPNTVTRMLEAWWEALSKRMAGEHLLPELPAEVAAAFKTVWVSASAHGRQGAETALAAQQAQLTADRAALDADRLQGKAEIEIAEALLREANLARVAVEARLGDLQRQLDQQIERSADAVRQRDQVQLRNEQLELELSTVRATLQTQEIAAAAEREALSAHVRAVEERTHAEVDRAREEAKGLRAQLTQLEGERAKLAQETEQERRESRAALQQSERKAAASEAIAYALEQQLARLGDLPAAWQSAQAALEAAAQREQALRTELARSSPVSRKRAPPVAKPPKTGSVAGTARRKNKPA